ncbi:hypothetical protein OL233_06390 [Vagococcus sp. PNs007]|uniref:Uncharacterized protein n=1 Tax=Vagococcus proximus TaxID=2991417 RepID=A0ABT5X1N9_9ENTE|nr:hypothetical protein [Vagococcus proximus]MDF0479918.1 hypothetical protein [Vagococcus proximus]
MKLSNGWKIDYGNDDSKFKLFSNTENENEYIVRGSLENGPIISFILSEDSIEILETAWQIASVNVNWAKKVITLNEYEESDD